ncbi:MAG: glycosyltransferase family 4 protein [Thermoprotei archaeon]|nr:glycosyltransferase family 4 protein [Thermoprotei archaeon]
MRIVFVTDSYKPKIGGIENLVYEIATTLSRSHEVIVVTSFKKGGSRDFYVYESDGAFRVVRVKSEILNYNGVTLNPKTWMALYKVIKKLDPDVVHGQGLYSTLSIAGTVLSYRFLGKPSLLTAHSFIGRDTPMFIVGGFKVSAKKVGLVTAVSRALAEEIVKRLGVSRVAVTYNCLRSEEWLRRGSEALELEGDPIIVSVIRLTYRKNPLTLVKVAEALSRELPKAKLYIAGDGPLRKPLERRVKARGLRNIVFLGALNRDNVKRLLWASDVFVLPSRTEAFGMSALEAMAAGVPVVALKIGGLPELVSHGVTGYLASSEEELVRLTVELAGDPGLAAKMGSQAMLRASEFDCQRMMPRYIAVYRLASKICEGGDL